MERFSTKRPVMAGFIAQMGNTTVGVGPSGFIFIVDLIIRIYNDKLLAILYFLELFYTFAMKRAMTLKEMTTKTDQLVFPEHIVAYQSC